MSLMHKDIPYINDGNPCHTLDISLPECSDIKAVLIYIHGGGIEGGSKEIPCECFPEEKYKIMENTHHCTYVNDRLFGELLVKFILTKLVQNA